jgi:hypothetical protein
MKVEEGEKKPSGFVSPKAAKSQIADAGMSAKKP